MPTKAKPRKGRTPLRFLLLDIPGEHEIEGNLATECQVIAAVLANLELNRVTKHIRIASTRKLRNLGPYVYDPEVVHLAGHATEEGLWIQGQVTNWEALATRLADLIVPLRLCQERVLNLSCCHSSIASRICTELLRDYFTGIYRFSIPEVPYAQALVAWTMFFFKSPSLADHLEISRTVNSFFGQSIIQFERVLSKHIIELERLAARPFP